MCSPNSLPKNFKIPSKLTKYILQNETLKIRKDLQLSEKNQEKKKKEKGSSKNEKIKCFNYEKVRHVGYPNHKNIKKTTETTWDDCQSNNCKLEDSYKSKDDITLLYM